MLLLLERCFDEALAGCPQERHPALAQAFARSLRILPMPTPAEIAELGFPLAAQYRLRLGLLKPIAYDLFRERLQLSQAAFARKHDWRLYAERFGHEPAYVNAKLKVMLLTYGEWAHLTDCIDRPFPLPPRLRAMLTDQPVGEP